MKQPTIARIWRGRTRRERADEYEAYNYEAGIKPLIKMALGVQTFREDLENETEFMTISYWESIEAMRALHEQRSHGGPSPGAGCGIPDRASEEGADPAAPEEPRPDLFGS